MSKKILSPFKRKVHIDEKEWTYRITRRTLHICNPEQTQKWTFFIDQQEKEIEYENDPWDYDDMDYDYSGPDHSPITPKKVQKVIEAKILKTSDDLKTQEGTKESPLVL